MRPFPLSASLLTSSRGLAFAGLAFGGASIGCSAPVSESLTRDAADLTVRGASSAAVVVVERTVSPDDSARGSIVARFLKMRAGSVDDEALRMVGATLDLPEEGTCATQLNASEAPAIVSLAVPRAVELLDVGPITVDANGLHTALEARALPDIVDLLSGVVYSSRSVETPSVKTPSVNSGSVQSAAGRGLYQLMSGGTDADHPPFTISASAPGEPDELRINALNPRASIELSSSEPIALVWDASGAAADDVIYVDVAFPAAHQDARQGEPQSFRCAFADVGSASIPVSAFGVVVDAGTTTGTMTVHRVHREAFHVSGIESGVLRFDFARTVEFTRR